MVEAEPEPRSWAPPGGPLGPTMASPLQHAQRHMTAQCPQAPALQPSPELVHRVGMGFGGSGAPGLWGSGAEVGVGGR